MESPRFYSLKIWLPITRILPLSTFPNRYWRKLIFILDHFIEVFGPVLRISGGKLVARDGKLAVVKLYSNSLIGSRGQSIKVPEDSCIFQKVLQTGSWELNECKFLAAGLYRASSRSVSHTAFVDIGAHVALMTLQSMNIAKTRNDLILFEPIPTHVSAIKFNLANFHHATKILIFESALSDRDGTASIFIDDKNYGRSTLLPPQFDSGPRNSIDINIMDTNRIFNQIGDYHNYVIKCDTEGFDALVCANIPDKVWKNTICAVIEISAWDNVSKIHVDKILSVWSELFDWSWGPYFNKSSNFVEIREFWLSKSDQQKNLFLMNKELN